MDIYNLSTEQLEDTLTQAMKVILTFLHENGAISSDVLKDYHTNYAMLVRKPTFFSKAWKALVGPKGESRPCMIIVQQKNLRLPEEDNNPEPEKKTKKEGSVISFDFKNGKDE